MKLAMRLADRKRFVRVEITPPRRLDVPRGDEAILGLLRDVLARRRLMREPPRASLVVPMTEEAEGQAGALAGGAAAT